MLSPNRSRHVEGGLWVAARLAADGFSGSRAGRLNEAGGRRSGGPVGDGLVDDTTVGSSAGLSRRLQPRSDLTGARVRLQTRQLEMPKPGFRWETSTECGMGLEGGNDIRWQRRSRLGRARSGLPGGASSRYLLGDAGGSSTTLPASCEGLTTSSPTSYRHDDRFRRVADDVTAQSCNGGLRLTQTSGIKDEYRKAASVTGSGTASEGTALRRRKGAPVLINKRSQRRREVCARERAGVDRSQCVRTRDDATVRWDLVGGAREFGRWEGEQAGTTAIDHNDSKR